MLTKYLTHLTCTFNPLSRSVAHKTPRLLLSFLPSNAASQGLKVSANILPQASKAASRIVVGFKDGREVIFEEVGAGPVKEGEVKDAGGAKEGVLDLRLMGINDVVEEVDRHCRTLRRKEELSG